MAKRTKNALYLGENAIDIKASPYAKYSPIDWAMTFIERYGGFEGAHHKAWVLDQVARLLKGSPIINLRVAKWDNGTIEYRYDVGESEEYKAWVKEMQGKYDTVSESYEYDYDVGIPP